MNKKSNSQSVLKKTGTVAKGAVAEVSGFNFLKRGISSNYRAVKHAVDYGIDLTKATIRKPNDSSENLVAVEDVSLVQRQIMQANALVSGTISITALVMTVFVSIPLIYNSFSDVVAKVMQNESLTYAFSIAVSLVAFIYLALYAYVSLIDFKAINKKTLAPIALCEEYQASFHSLALILLLQNAACLLMQTAPDISPLRTIAGILSISLSISLINSARKIYSPTLQATKNNTMIKTLFTALMGFTTYRSVKNHAIAISKPVFLLFFTMSICLLNIFTKEPSVVSIISFFASIIGIGVLVAIYTHAWKLKHD